MTRNNPVDIIFSALKDQQTDILELMPRLQSMTTMIDRIRNKEIGFVPAEAEDIPYELRLNTKGETFFRIAPVITIPIELFFLHHNLKKYTLKHQKFG